MKKRYWLISLILAIVLLMIALPVSAASPGEPPGLAKAIAAQEKHQEALLNAPGVAGLGIGFNGGNQPVIIIFTENSGVGGMPTFLDGIPVKVVVSGKFTASPRPDKVSKIKNNPPKVSITEPADGTSYLSGSEVYFAGSASDKQDGDITDSIVWTTEGQEPVTGGSGSFTGLADGMHTIIATVTDSGGLKASDSVTINIGSAQFDPTEWCARPVYIGVSTGHPDITAGTIGARVKIGNVLYALSNNHVYADENKAVIGDNVLQPGTYDGGTDPVDAIGTLYDFEPIVFSRAAYNTIDAAIAEVLLDNGAPVVDNSTPPGGYGTPTSSVAEAYVGMSVQKYGRTTMFTTGTVYAVNVTVKVGYDSGVARFVNQIIITPGTFSAGGDSGSLIVDADLNPVGLLFAGSTSYTIANPIQAVLDRFSITIDGTP